MNGYLVDANLSRRIELWQNDAFEYVIDFNVELSDSEIWNYAKNNDLTILTKDSDFSFRILFSEPPPRIIHFKIGNMILPEFVLFVEEHWETIRLLSQKHKLVSIFPNRIEVV